MNEKIRSRVRKLLALAHDPSNEAEARLAANRAREIMAKHGITEESLQDKPKMIGYRVNIHRRSPRLPRWKQDLAYTVAEYLGIFVFRWKGVSDFQVYGERRDVDVFTYIFAMAGRQINAACDKYIERRKQKGRIESGGHTRKLRTDFRRNAVLAFGKRLTNDARRSDAADPGTALVRESRYAEMERVANAQVTINYTRREEVNVRDEDAARKGREAGRKVRVSNTAPKGELT